MTKLTMTSIDKTKQNIEIISSFFPNCITEAIDEDGDIQQAIDFDLLKQELSKQSIVVDDSIQRYTMNWPDKYKSIFLANQPTTKTLRPVVEDQTIATGEDSNGNAYCSTSGINFDTTQNLYIEGDNLDVLKILRESYQNKIKIIYIDPPYNTGNDFVYDDDFSMDKEEYIEKSGQVDEYGNRFFQNTESNGRFHTNWLNMIYPRLKVARDLLTEDGVIFVSIDDNEVHNLRKVCDEIFGAGNFVGDFPRVTKKGGKSSDFIAKNHDFILVYSRDRVELKLYAPDHNDDGYSNKDEYFEERGYYKLNQTLDYDSLGYVKSLDYPIIIDGITYYAGGNEIEYIKRQQGNHGRADWGWRWRWSKELFNIAYEKGFVVVKSNLNGRSRIYTKTYQKATIEKVLKHYEVVRINRTKPLSTLEFTLNQYSNDNSKKSFDELFKERGLFEYTKPTELIKKIVQYSTGGGHSPRFF